MREIMELAAMTALVMAACALVAVNDAQPVGHAQAHHPYDPFTVEVEIRDR